MTLTVTPYIYLVDGDDRHAALLDVLDTAAFSDIETATLAMEALRNEVASTVFGDVLNVEFDVC